MSDRIDDDAPAAAAPPVHRWWWGHDARWYQGVARRYGQEVANEINAEALAFVARRVAEWVRQQDGRDLDALEWSEVVEVFERVPRSMWSDDMMAFHCVVHGEGEWETVVTRNYAVKMLRAARSLEGYRCPCLRMRAAWFTGLGLEVDDRCVGCEITGDADCRFRAVARRPGRTA